MAMKPKKMRGGGMVKKASKGAAHATKKAPIVQKAAARRAVAGMPVGMKKGGKVR